jgi:hypothetical protein
MVEVEQRKLHVKENVFKNLLIQGARTARYNNTKISVIEIIKTMEEKSMNLLAIQRELVDESKDFDKTEAGIAPLKKIDRATTGVDQEDGGC